MCLRNYLVFDMRLRNENWILEVFQMDQCWPKKLLNTGQFGITNATSTYLCGCCILLGLHRPCKPVQHNWVKKVISAVLSKRATKAYDYIFLG